MQQIRLIVIPDSFIKTKSITGNIYFQIDDFFFPEEGWNDFVVIILSWWLRALENNKNDFELLFMDGPLKIIAKTAKENEISLLFMHGETCVYKTDCTKSDLEKQLLKAAGKTLRKVSEEKWEAVEIDGLREVVYRRTE